MTESNILWRALEWPGLEHLQLTISDSGSIADGLIVAANDQIPIRLRYRVEIDARWRFRRLQVFEAYAPAPSQGDPAAAGVIRELTRAAGSWSQKGFESIQGLNNCIDIDISATPFTNTLPIRRLDLDIGESSEIDVAYVAVPDLTLSSASQRYTRLDERSYRFESLDIDFTADITVDDLGLVVDYPQLFERVWPGQDIGTGVTR